MPDGRKEPVGGRGNLLNISGWNEPAARGCGGPLVGRQLSRARGPAEWGPGKTREPSHRGHQNSLRPCARGIPVGSTLLRFQGSYVSDEGGTQQLLTMIQATPLPWTMVFALPPEAEGDDPATASALVATPAFAPREKQDDSYEEPKKKESREQKKRAWDDKDGGEGEGKPRKKRAAAAESEPAADSPSALVEHEQPAPAAPRQAEAPVGAEVAAAPSQLAGAQASAAAAAAPAVPQTAGTEPGLSIQFLAGEEDAAAEAAALIDVLRCSVCQEMFDNPMQMVSASTVQMVSPRAGCLHRWLWV